MSMHENCQLLALRPKNSQLGNKQPMILIANFLLGKMNGKNLKKNFIAQKFICGDISLY